MSIKRIFSVISIFALSAIVLIAYPSTDKTMNAGQSIPSQDAAALTNIHRVSVSSDDVLIHYFGKDVVEKTMNQPGCVGVRTFYGKRTDGKAGFVIVGVDKYGTDMKSYATTPGGTKVCPPNCGG
jgi:hypothetical protein